MMNETANNKTIIARKCKIVGEISAGSIEIQKGAALKGSLNINNQG